MSADEDAFLKEKVFGPVAKWILSRRDLLPKIDVQPSGFEKWFTHQAASALGLVRPENFPPDNRGPDLKLDNGRCIELKAATDCRAKYILNGLKYRTACVFLGGGTQISNHLQELELGSRVLASERFSVGPDNWIVGLIVPRD
jgi:hypothetical protein